jgi:DNA-binding CsgD family transcriptional regulator
LYNRFLLEDLPAAPPKLDGRDQALGLFEKKRSEFDVKHLVYGIIHAGRGEKALPFDAISTYSLEWQQRYFMQRYFVLDPVLQQNYRNRTPFDWQAQNQTKSNLQAFFAESREFGVGANGLAIPIRGENGELCCLSFSSDLTKKDWERFKTEILPHIFLFAHEFHARAHDIRHPKVDEVQLSGRELEVLKWAAEGKSMQDTAQILSISEHSVRTYLQNCQRKLKGANKLHTVVQALRIGVIR